MKNAEWRGLLRILEGEREERQWLLLTTGAL